MILKPLVHLGDRFLLFSTFVQKKEEEEIATYRPAAAGKKSSPRQWTDIVLLRDKMNCGLDL